MSEILNTIANSLGMVHKYKLVYFDARGAAEPVRWCFAYGGTNYEDVRVKRADWPAMKASTPFGQLPYLEIDGKPLPQSMALTRYVARQNGLVGKDDFEAAQADALVDYVGDAAKGLAFLYSEQDEKKKTTLKEAFIKEGVQPFLKGIERILLANNNGEGFLVGAKPTWADFVVVVFLDRLSTMDNAVLENYKSLKALQGRVHELKGIKEWLVKRPVTEN